MKEHFFKERYTGSIFKKAIDKYGNLHFNIEVIEECIRDKDYLTQREQHFFDQFNPFDSNGYNIQREAGRSNFGVNWSNDVKEKISNGLKEYYKTHENPFKGRKHTEEMRNFLSNIRKGTTHTEECKENMSITHKKLNSVKRLQEHNKKNGHPRLTPIIQLTKTGNPIKVYGSTKEASNSTGIGRANITNCITKYSKTAGGYKWMKYKDFHK
jgi:group I intron endonuclease